MSLVIKSLLLKLKAGTHVRTGAFCTPVRIGTPGSCIPAFKQDVVNMVSDYVQTACWIYL